MNMFEIIRLIIEQQGFFYQDNIKRCFKRIKLALLNSCPNNDFNELKGPLGRKKTFFGGYRRICYVLALCTYINLCLHFIHIENKIGIVKLF